MWRIHRKIGMSGGLLTNMLLRETGLPLDAALIERLRGVHISAYRRLDPAQLLVHLERWVDLIVRKRSALTP